MSASTQCPHSDIAFHVNNAGFGDTNVHILELSGRCSICDRPLEFLGRFPVGVSFANPTVSLDRNCLSLPFVADGDVPDSQLEVILTKGPTP